MATSETNETRITVGYGSGDLPADADITSRVSGE